MLLNEAYHIVSKEVLNHPSVKGGVHAALLALHESATKLWQAVENQQTEKLSPRAAAALISVFAVMRELGITDPEACLIQKLNDLKTEGGS
mgnify:FL=1